MFFFFFFFFNDTATTEIYTLSLHDALPIYKYCHCLLFVNKEGLPITEYLPEGHEALESYGVIKDPEPEKGRPLRDKAAEREKERIDRPS